VIVSDIIDRIDQATGCQHCGGPLAGSVSDDFCRPECQSAWHATHAKPLIGYSEPTDLPMHVYNQVEDRSPEVTPPSWWSEAIYLQATRSARERAAGSRRAA
jgi:hypothetical protein